MNTNPPRLSQFSGSGAKGEICYEQWRFEVRGIQKGANYTEALLLQSIRRNVRGPAADLVLHLGEDATVDVVLGKLDQIFGSILPVGDFT